MRTTRRFDQPLDAEGPQAGQAELALVAAQLTRAGVNTRFLPQLATSFGIDDPDELARQLAGGFAVAAAAGQDFEEIFSEITDSPQVYQAAGSFPQAVAFLAEAGVVPAEATIGLEGGTRSFTGEPVTADLAAIFAGLPGYADRRANVAGETDFFGGIGVDFFNRVPILNQAGRIEYDRLTTEPVPQEFAEPAGTVLVDGIPVGEAEAAAGREQAIAEREARQERVEGRGPAVRAGHEIARQGRLRREVPAPPGHS